MDLRPLHQLVPLQLQRTHRRLRGFLLLLSRAIILVGSDSKMAHLGVRRVDSRINLAVVLGDNLRIVPRMELLPLEEILSVRRRHLLLLPCRLIKRQCLSSS